MAQTTGRSAFLEILSQEGVTHLFGNPGTTELPIMDALAEHAQIRYVLGLQEAAVVTMAEGYARATGELAVANVHVAPGLGNAMGAKVIAAASSDEKLSVASTAGASMTVNYSEEDLKSRVKELAGPGGVDVVYDPVGGELSDPALRCLGAGGRFLVIGFAAGDIPRIPLNLVLLKECHIIGVFWGSWARREPKTQVKNVAAMMKMFKEGKIKPLVADVFEFRDYEAAFERITSRQAKGKVILELIPAD